MTARIAIIVCDTPANAATARAFLEDPAQGYTVTVEVVTTKITYDALSFGGGGLTDSPAGKQLVIGRKQ